MWDHTGIRQLWACGQAQWEWNIYKAVYDLFDVKSSNAKIFESETERKNWIQTDVIRVFAVSQRWIKNAKTQRKNNSEKNTFECADRALKSK